MLDRRSSMRRLAFLVCFTALQATSAGCAPQVPRATTVTTATASHWRVELFFGRGLKTGGEVSDAEWQRFVDEVLTPAFPDGLSILDAAGQWRGASGVIEHERSKVVVVILAGERVDESRIDQVRSAYRERFGQESVMRVVGKVEVGF
ncbi:MAG: DUF3574 domain-containing protein [Polyangiales bacterium]